MRTLRGPAVGCVCLALRAMIASLICFAVCVPGGAAHAQSGVVWEPPTNVSDTPTYSENPSVVADPSGGVHILWGEALTDGLDVTTAIMYSQLDGEAWSPARDVLLAPQGITAQAARPAAAIGEGGELYVVFAGGWGGGIFFSAVGASEAIRPSAWREPKTLYESGSSVSDPRIAVDSEGNIQVLFVVAAGPDRGVYYTRSEDLGRQWTWPLRIPGSQMEPNTQIVDARLALGARGAMHAVWSWTELPETFPPRGIMYAGSADRGESWSLPLALAEGPFRFPAIATQAGGEIHVFWSGTGEQRQKFHRYSRDGGLTWSDAWRFVKLGGFQADAGAATDSDDVLHVVMPTSHQDSTSDVLVHSQWEDQKWTEPEILLRDTHRFGETRVNIEFAQIAVSEGNTLNVVFEYPVVTVPGSDQQIDIFYMRGRTQAPYIQPVPLPTVTPEPTVTPRPTAATPTGTTNPEEPSPQAWGSRPDPGPSGGPMSPQTVLAVGVGSVMVALLAVVLTQRGRR